MSNSGKPGENYSRPSAAPSESKAQFADSSSAGNSSTAPTNSQKRKKVFLIGGIIILIIAIVFGIPWYIHYEKYVSTDDAYVRTHVTYVSPRVAAQVREVLVHDNEYVKKGTLLVLLDPRDYQATVAKCKALLEEALAARQGSRYSLSLIRQTSPAALSEAK
ncbi:MAG: biotin/lipoyl-binding protein, partial [Phycisphaerae bacterium]